MYLQATVLRCAVLPGLNQSLLLYSENSNVVAAAEIAGKGTKVLQDLLQKLSLAVQNSSGSAGWYSFFSNTAWRFLI